MGAVATAVLVLVLSLSFVASPAICDVFDRSERCDAVFSAGSLRSPRASVSSGTGKLLHALPIVAIVGTLSPPLRSVPVTRPVVVPWSLPPVASVRVLRI
jgi:hypothetical protein